MDEMMKKFGELTTVLETKVDLTQFSKVLDQFQRFAEYDDLRKLHTLVIPEISKFEKKIQENDAALDSFRQILRNFDENIQTKANKMTVDKYFETIQKDSVNQSMLEAFVNQHNERQEQILENIDLQKRMLETFNSNLRQRIEQEVYRQTFDMRNGSHSPERNYCEMLLERMVDKQEFTSELDKKASKIHFDNCMRSINLLHD